MKPYDLLLRHGTLYDPVQGVCGQRRDIAIAGGRVSALAEVIDPGLATEVRDLSGKLVSPGWIDIHVHGYGGIALKDIQAVGVLGGVTACVDAGDFGTLTFDDFMAVRADSVADMYGYVHMHPAGIPYTGLARGDYRSIPVGTLIQLIESSRHVVKGLKLSALGDMPLHNLKVAKVITAAAGVPFYMHIGEVSNYPAKRSITRQAIGLLTEGDIITHIYTGDFGRILGADGRLFPEIVEARRRGVVFDIGHGIGNFAFDIAERALEQGIEPDVISSDQNALCINAPSDLATTMSKFLVLGLSLEDVVAKVTAGPRVVLDFEAHGTLAVGAAADITVFHLETGDFEFDDSARGMRRASQRIVPDVTYKAGRAYACDVDDIVSERNFKMVVRDPSTVDPGEFAGAERAFLGRVFRRLEALGEAKSDALHVQVHQAMDDAGVDKAEGLRTLYRLVFGPAGAGFTPQIGWLLSRIGTGQLTRYREVLA